ncbi:unnamed protein product, partial [marine sediment metagenome]
NIPAGMVTGVFASLSTGTVNFVWTRNLELDIASYVVFVSTYSCNFTLKQETGTVPQPSIYQKKVLFNHTGLTGGTTYYYQVINRDFSSNQSIFSAEISEFVTGISPPSAPTGFYGIALSTVSIKWEWSITAPATYYNIYNNADNSLLTTLDGTGTTSWIEIGLSSNTQYSRYIKAGNAGGLSGSSASVYKYTLAYPPETLNAVSVSSSQIDLSWSYSGATKYEVWYSTVGSLYRNIASTVTSPTLTYNHTGLTPGVTHYYWIKAVNGEDITN